MEVLEVGKTAGCLPNRQRGGQMNSTQARPEDDAGLTGKVAIIAGGGAAGDGIGNGRAAAILLARAGTRVVVVDRDLALAERTVAMIAGEGGAAVAHRADLTQNDECRDMVAAALDRFGRIDFLDNNVGIGGRGTVVDGDPEVWRRVLQVNVEAMFLVSRHVIPAMIRTAGRGAIVNISSISALRPYGLTPYAASKGAVISLTRAMATDHAKDGIRVNCVAPGPVYTPMVYARGMSPELREKRRSASLLKIEGTGWDVGHAVRFLLSDHARYITGQVLVVDGGVTLCSPARQPERNEGGQ
jgi:NAD(P)-dependent dehydrogenase (short-subunit alcohol dehydrogenase family)